MSQANRGLARQLGLFGATTLVMGVIIGAGIFMNPHVVAQQVHTPTLIRDALRSAIAVCISSWVNFITTASLTKAENG